jgi:hypothetical protein
MGANRRSFIVALAGLAAGFPALAQTQLRPPVRVTLEARVAAGTPPVQDGLSWRVFGATVAEDGKLPLLGEASGGTKSFDMTPGTYLVHVGYGFSGVVRKLTVGTSAMQETIVLNAGALQLNGVTAEDVKIAPALLSFDVYSAEVDERGERQLIARAVKPGEIVPFPAGTFHVVSQYGKLNAEVRADIRVEAGKTTQATMLHRAARMSFRLVKSAGGDAIADTAWSIITESGDVITESSSAFPVFVLTEGNYTAIAKNDEKIYSRDFEVLAGVDTDVEILAE